MKINLNDLNKYIDYLKRIYNNANIIDNFSNVHGTTMIKIKFKIDPASLVDILNCCIDTYAFFNSILLSYKDYLYNVRKELKEDNYIKNNNTELINGYNKSIIFVSKCVGMYLYRQFFDKKEDIYFPDLLYYCLLYKENYNYFESNLSYFPKLFIDSILEFIKLNKIKENINLIINMCKESKINNKELDYLLSFSKC